MSNLFGTFDPSGLAGLPLGWVSSAMVAFIFVGGFWVSKSQQGALSRTLLMSLYGEFKALTGPAYPPGGLIIPIGLFCSVLFMNFVGLVPYFFTSSSHLSCTLSLALSLWLGHVAMAWLVTSENMFSHLIPSGTPAALMPFMVLIELVSSVIRPLTLSVRLAANMIAGHLLMTLLSNQVSPVMPLWGYATLIGLSALVVLESAVAVIQSYVFSVLSSLYLAEVSDPKLS